jgi:hypothetical protein
MDGAAVQPISPIGLYGGMEGDPPTEYTCMRTYSPPKAQINANFIFPPTHLIVIKLKMFQHF